VATTLQPLFIVRQDRPDLYEHLRARFGETSQVILDRRNGDRRNGDRQNGAGRNGAGRQASTRVTADRRWRDRREPVSRTERASWENAGYYLIFEDPAEPPGVVSRASDTSRIMAQPST
jgi:hypothetical protein